MEIIKQIEVKQVLTELSKSRLEQKFLLHKEQLQKECDQLQFQLKRIEKNKNSVKTNALEQMYREIEEREQKQKLLEFQLEQLKILPIGSELRDSKIDAIVEVQVGTNWDELMKESTIVIKDGIVTEIR